MTDLATYMADSVDAFSVYLVNNGDVFRQMDAAGRRDTLAARLHEIGYGVADCGGTLKDAESLGSDLWSLIVQRLVLAGVSLPISGMQFVLAHLRVGYHQHAGKRPPGDQAVG